MLESALEGDRKPSLMGISHGVGKPAMKRQLSNHFKKKEITLVDW